MVICRSFIAIGAALLSIGCTGMPDANRWQAAVERQAGQLGYRNWIVIAEASFPPNEVPSARRLSVLNFQFVLEH